MVKLYKKVHLTIFLILVSIVFALFLFYNTQNYLRVYDDTKVVFGKIEDNNSRLFPNNDTFKNKKSNISNNNFDNIENKNNFMVLDKEIYTVIFNIDYSILDIYNNSGNFTNSDEIKNIVNKILYTSNIKHLYIGNLFIDDYCYCFPNNFSLVILDNANTKTLLWSTLLYSFLIVLFFTIALFFLTKYITNWIVKPAKESFEKQKNFIADASHELKTPLSVIIASSDALEQMPTETKWIKNIQEESKRMNNLISNLLKLASTENSTYLKFEIGNLSNIIELAALTFEGRAFEQNIKINFDIQDNIEFTFDENSIKQLVEILLDNALKHTLDNRDISLRLNKDNKLIKLKVINYGEDIPKGQEKYIFERFYRSDKSRSFKDNRYGLGLSIAKNIVEQHKGRICAISKEGITTFKVVFYS